MCSSNPFGREVKGELVYKNNIFMNKNLQNKNSVSLCYKGNCIQATGDNAKLIAFGAFAMLLLIGISSLAKSN